MDETESQSQSDVGRNSIDTAAAAAAIVAGMRPPAFDAGAVSGAGPGPGGITVGSALGRASSLQQLVRPSQLAGIQTGGLRNSNMNQCNHLLAPSYPPPSFPSLPYFYLGTLPALAP